MKFYCFLSGIQQLVVGPDKNDLKSVNVLPLLTRIDRNESAWKHESEQLSELSAF
jgi:hypothetical protein